MKILAAIIMLAAFASAQAPQQQKLTIIGSYGNGLSGPGCIPTSWYGYRATCTFHAYMVTKDARGRDVYTKYVLACGMKGQDAHACANLIAKDVWPFVYIDNSEYCGVGRPTARVWMGSGYTSSEGGIGGNSTLKGRDGKDYPIKCIQLLGTKEKLVYTIMKEDDIWCLVGEEFCRK